MSTTINNREVSPCICAKLKYALGITATKPSNSKTCSQQYWDEIVDYFDKINSCRTSIIDLAKKRTDLFKA